MSYVKSPSVGTPSVYSHVTSRSTANLRSQRSRSVKSLKTPWYQRPILTNTGLSNVDVQRASMFTAIFSLLLSIFTIITAIFDMYCYYMASPGSTHYGHYVISYEFVYVGSRHVRNVLVMFAAFSVLGSIALFVTSIIIINALRKEHEKKMVPWLICFGIFTIFRLLAFLFFSIVNDMIFFYNIMMCLLWCIFIVMSVYGWLLVYSLYVELTDLTKLEDLAHLRGIAGKLGGLLKSLSKLQAVNFKDGHDGLTERIDSPFPGGLSSDDAPQYSFDDACELDTITDPIPGPSRSISFITDTDNSTATKSTLPI